MLSATFYYHSFVSFHFISFLSQLHALSRSLSLSLSLPLSLPFYHYFLRLSCPYILSLLIHYCSTHFAISHNIIIQDYIFTIFPTPSLCLLHIQAHPAFQHRHILKAVIPQIPTQTAQPCWLQRCSSSGTSFWTLIEPQSSSVLLFCPCILSFQRSANFSFPHTSSFFSWL